MIGKTFQKDGRNMLGIDKMNIKIKIGKGKIDLKNLFGGDKTLGLSIFVKQSTIF